MFSSAFKNSGEDKIISTIKCNECQKSFSALYNLRKHARHFHPDKIDAIVPQKTYKHSCPDCKRNFSHVRNFKQHRRKHHGFVDIDSRKPRKLYCPLCSFNDIKMELVKHFFDEHKIAIEEKKLDFNTFDEFIIWKKNVERNTKSLFVKQRGIFKARKQISINYFCHRSGTFISKGTSARRLKLQGSNKINGFCPASIKVQIDKNNKCKVYHIDQHVGHENDLNHLSFTVEERETVARKIIQKIPFNEILEEAQNADDSQNQRLSLLTKRDLLNIRKSVKLLEANGHIVHNEILDDENFVEEVEISTHHSDEDENDAQSFAENLDSNNEFNKNSVEETDHIYANANSFSKPQIKIIDESSIVLKEKEKIITDLIPNIIKAVDNIFCMEQIEAVKKLCEPIVSTLAQIESKYVEMQEIQLNDPGEKNVHSIIYFDNDILNPKQSNC